MAELAAQEDHWLEAQGRLTEPMRYDAASDRYLPLSWDEAFAQIARTPVRRKPRSANNSVAARRMRARVGSDG